MKKLFFLALSAAMLSAASAFAVVDGAVEPDFRYPWVVDIGGDYCRGVLIEPQWVLTAAHCVESGTFDGHVGYERTDGSSGHRYRDVQSVSPALDLFLHPSYDAAGSDGLANDIALIHLPRPFFPGRYIQTAALPANQRYEGPTGALANRDQRDPLPEGSYSVFRGKIPKFDTTFSSFFEIRSYDPGSSGILCRGDSGSGLVTYENGRATVRGVTRRTSMPNCATATNMQATSFSDVFFYKDWILRTIGKTEYELAGNTRVHASGTPAYGAMGIGCSNPYDTLWGPLNAPGAEVGSNCARSQKQVVICSLDPGQDQDVGILAFGMTEIHQFGPTTYQQLPLDGDTFAVYTDELPLGVTRIFNCKIGPRGKPAEDIPGNKEIKP